MKNKIIELLKENSSTLDIVAHNTPSTITFIGSVNYEDIATKICDLIGNPVVQISEKKVGMLKRNHAKYLFSNEASVSLVLQHLETLKNSIIEARDARVTEEVKRAGEFVNENCLDSFIENIQHNMRIQILSIEEKEVFWLKKQ